MAPNQTVTTTTNSVTIDVIPRVLYVFCRPTNSQLNQNVSDCFAAISNVTIQWGGQVIHTYTSCSFTRA